MHKRLITVREAKQKISRFNSELYAFITVLNRIKAKFIDTEVRLEYVPKDSDVGVAFIMKISR